MRRWAFAATASYVLTSAVALAQPAVLSVVPTNGATGVLPISSVVFTFNTVMDTNISSASFFVSPSFTQQPVSNSWNVTRTKLTCAPLPAFATNSMILWFVSAFDTNGTMASGQINGSFTTGGTAVLLTNWAVTNGVYSFDVKTGSNVTVRVDYKTNLSTTNWFTLTTTNSGVSGTVRVTDAQSVTNRRIYRGHIGP